MSSCLSLTDRFNAERLHVLGKKLFKVQSRHTHHCARVSAGQRLLRLRQLADASTATQDDRVDIGDDLRRSVHVVVALDPRRPHPHHLHSSAFLFHGLLRRIYSRPAAAWQRIRLGAKHEGSDGGNGA